MGFLTKLGFLIILFGIFYFFFPLFTSPFGTGLTSIVIILFGIILAAWSSYRVTNPPPGKGVY
jgi:hypothetical protein